MSIMTIVEEKVKELQDFIQNHISSINNIAATIEQLLTNKSNLQAEVHRLTGAVQAFNDVSNAIKSGNVEATAKDVEALAAVAGSVIPGAAPVAAIIEGVATVASDVVSSA